MLKYDVFLPLSEMSVYRSSEAKKREERSREALQAYEDWLDHIEEREPLRLYEEARASAVVKGRPPWWPGGSSNSLLRCWAVPLGSTLDIHQDASDVTTRDSLYTANEAKLRECTDTAIKGVKSKYTLGTRCRREDPRRWSAWSSQGYTGSTAHVHKFLQEILFVVINRMKERLRYYY